MTKNQLLFWRDSWKLMQSAGRPVGPLAAVIICTAYMAPAWAVDEVKVVENHLGIDIVLDEVDFTFADNDPRSLFGVSRQFLDGQPILVEVTLTDPLTEQQLEQIKSDGETTAIHFRCGDTTLYLAADTYGVGALDCSILDPSDL